MSVRKVIDRVLDKQNAKGMATYGQTLDDCPDDAYEWNVMALEEMADGMQYMAKENVRLRRLLQAEKVKVKLLEQQINRGGQYESKVESCHTQRSN